MICKTSAALWPMLQRLRQDERGITAVLVALTLMALIGFTGLGVETGLWYTIQRYNQSAADVAAISGAMEQSGSRAYSDICALAENAAKANGFNVATTWSCPTASPATQASCTGLTSGQMCVNNPPLFGNYAGQSNYVEVILAQQQSSLFSLPWLPNVMIDTRAVATVPQISTCMVALSATGTDLEYTGGGHGSLNIPNCAFASDSTDQDSINLQGNFDIIAGAIDTAGNYSIKGATGTVIPPIVTNAPVVADPYGTVMIGTVPSGACAPDPNVQSGSVTLVPGTAYCALTISGGTVTIPAGLYYLVGTSGNEGAAGNLTISGGTVNGSGVTFVLTAASGVSAAGTIQITGGSGTLTAPGANAGLLPPSAAASGGLLILQDPATSANSGSNTITPGCGASALVLTGAIDTSLTEDVVQGSPTSCSGCTELIAANFDLAGALYLDNSNCASVDVKTDTVPGTVALAE
jgi:Flp pilus assembly protein TadG